MKAIKVLNKEGQDTGRTIDLPEAVFGIEPNEHSIWLDVRQFLANQRQGTHKSKERAEIAGSTKKIKKQKGTGTARAGSIKSPVFRGGGRVFGPRPRSYSFKLNRKVKMLARRSALSIKAANAGVVVVDSLGLDSIKTKQAVGVINALGVSDKKILFVTQNVNNSLVTATRNIPKVGVVAAADVNTYSVMNADTLVVEEGSVESIANILA